MVKDYTAVKKNTSSSHTSEKKKDSIRFYHYGLIGMVSFIILFSSLDYMFGFTANMPNNEKRKLADFPTYQAHEVSAFIDGFDAFFKDQFGGRRFFINAYCWFKLNILKTSPYPENVILGKDNWLFLGKSKAGIYDEHLGIRVVNKRQLDRMKTNVLENKQWAEAKGIKYYFMIAPDKYSIYPEQLPSNYSKKHIYHNLDRLIKYLSPEIEVIDVRQELLSRKDEALLYGLTDSHWTQYGAYIGYEKIINIIRKDFPGIPKPLALESFWIRQEEVSNQDMSTLINAGENFKDYDLIFNAKEGPAFDGIASRLKVPKGFKFNKNTYEYRYRAKPNNKIKILIIRDSFSNRLRKFIPAHFRETIFISNGHKFDKQLIEQEKPDIILHEMVERSFNESLLRY